MAGPAASPETGKPGLLDVSDNIRKMTACWQSFFFAFLREMRPVYIFRDAFNQVQNSGSNQDFGTTKAAKMYFSLSDPGPNAFAGKPVTPPEFSF